MGRPWSTKGSGREQARIIAHSFSFKYADATHVVSAVQGNRRLVDSYFEQVIVMTRIVRHFCFVKFQTVPMNLGILGIPSWEHIRASDYQL